MRKGGAPRAFVYVYVYVLYHPRIMNVIASNPVYKSIGSVLEGVCDEMVYENTCYVVCVSLSAFLYDVYLCRF